MVQFNGPYGKVSISYLRQGKLCPPAEPHQSFTGKTVLITGCSGGLGWEALLKVAERYPKKLFLSTRTSSQGEATKRNLLSEVKTLDPSTVHVVTVDYLSFDSISELVKTINTNTTTLDCVLLCAGQMQPYREITDDNWPSTFKVNVLAPTLIALELLPLLQSTPNSVLEFVSSTSYCNVSSVDIAPLIEDPSASALDFFNSAERWTPQRAYYESKLMLMFVVQGLASHSTDKDENLDVANSPIILAACPGQCKTSLYRNLSFGLRLFMQGLNSLIARTAEEGSRTLVTGLLQGREAHGKMWVNDTYDDWSPNITEEEWKDIQVRVWKELLEVLSKYRLAST